MPQILPILNNRAKGILYMLAASFLFAIMFALPKIADAGLNGFQATFIRYVTGLITIAPLAIWASRRGSPLATSAWPLIIVRASAGVGGVTCIIYATTHMVYADALAISFTDGAFIMVLAALILREKISVQRWLAALSCIIGAFLVAQPSTDLLGTIWIEPAAKIAFLGAFIMAGEVICIKHLTHRVSAPALLLYTNGCAVLMASVPAIALFDWPPLHNLTLYMLMGPIAILGQFLFMRSLRCDDVSALVPYKYSIILFGGVLGIQMFSEWPKLLSLFGAIMIVSASVFLSRFETRNME